MENWKIESEEQKSAKRCSTWVFLSAILSLELQHIGHRQSCWGARRSH